MNCVLIVNPFQNVGFSWVFFSNINIYKFDIILLKTKTCTFYIKKTQIYLYSFFSEQNDVCHNDVRHNTLFERYKLQDIANFKTSQTLT